MTVSSQWPLLYSYRRCPYAMRARMALKVAGIEHQTVEINLRDKPPHMVRVSPKATVPVLCVDQDMIIDESLDIMRWALAQSDPLGWLSGSDTPVAQQLLTQNDGPFKQALDQYKYASRFPGTDPQVARTQALHALIEPLARVLDTQPYIGGEAAILQDVAIFPFVRQFASVEPVWFDEAVPPCVRQWLAAWLASPLFAAIMQKLPTQRA